MNTNIIKHLNLFYLFMDTDMDKDKKNYTSKVLAKISKKVRKLQQQKSEFTAKQWNRPKVPKCAIKVPTSTIKYHKYS